MAFVLHTLRVFVALVGFCGEGSCCVVFYNRIINFYIASAMLGFVFVM
jgi:hypothetical protein